MYFTYECELTCEQEILKIGTVYEDVTTDVLGQMGAWQWMVTIVSTALMASAIFNQYEDIPLLKASSDIVCLPYNGYQTTNTSVCYVISINTSEQIRCNSWNVKLLGIFWLKKTWVMTCEHDRKLLSTAMVCRMGSMFGYVIYGLIADSFGRKKAMMLDVYSNVVLRLSIVLCSSESWFKLLIFMRSLLGSANNFIGLVLICEIASNRWRSSLSLIVASPRLLAAVCMVPLARAITNQESFTLIACLYHFLLMLVLRWTPESPQWLLFNNKSSQAENTIYKAAMKNRVVLCSDFKIRPVNHRAYYSLEENQTCIGVLSTHNTRVLILVSLLFWAMHCNAWYYLYVTIYSTEKSFYFPGKILCLACVIGCLTIVLSLKWKLRHLLIFNTLVAGASGAAILMCRQASEFVVNLLSALTLATMVIAFAITLIIVPRLFAINVRGTLLGCCQAAGQLGAIVSYLVITLDLLDSLTLAVLEITITATLVILCLIFPDVDSRELPDVLQDMDYFSELSKPLRWATQKTHSASHEEVELRNHSFGSWVRAHSSHSASTVRAPAQPIGFHTIWRMFTKCIRYIFCTTRFCKNKD